MSDRYPSPAVVRFGMLLMQRLGSRALWGAYGAGMDAWVDGELVVRLSGTGDDVTTKLMPNKSTGVTLENTSWAVVKRWLYENTYVLHDNGRTG